MDPSKKVIPPPPPRRHSKSNSVTIFPTDMLINDILSHNNENNENNEKIYPLQRKDCTIYFEFTPKK